MDALTTKTNKAAANRINKVLPCVTFTLPLKPANTAPAHLAKIEELIEKHLRDGYSKAISRPVVEKFRNAIEAIRKDSTKKSVVIFVSPGEEKVFHLDTPLEEKLVIDEPLEIRNLIENIHPLDKYLLLVQSATHFKVFLGDKNHLVHIKTHTPDHVAAFRNDIPEKIEYFTDTTDRKEVMLDKFIHHIDKELEHLLNEQRLPVFVMGAERMNGHFKKYTHNGKAILDYIHGNFDEATNDQLLKTIRPFLTEIRDKELAELKSGIEEAGNTSRFVSGIEEVWRNVMQKKGQRLIVEKDFFYPHFAQGGEELNGNVANTNPEFIRDAVDILIEKVLDYGGEVTFVEPGYLKDYRQIALFLYF